MIIMVWSDLGIIVLDWNWTGTGLEHLYSTINIFETHI